MDSALNHCSVGAAYMPPAALPLLPRIFCIVARDLDRLTAHNKRRQPAKLARSCGCLPCRGKHCSLPDFAPLNRGPTLTTPHLRGASRTPPPTTAIRKLFHNRKRARRPEGRPPYVLPLTEFAGENPSLPGRIPISQIKKVVPTIHRQHDLSYLYRVTPAGTGSGTPRSLHSAGAQKCRRGCLPRR